MNIKQVIDQCIDNGAKHLHLSPRQFNKIKRRLKVVNSKPNYRGALITRWGNGESHGGS